MCDSLQSHHQTRLNSNFPQHVFSQTHVGFSEFLSRVDMCVWDCGCCTMTDFSLNITIHLWIRIWIFCIWPIYIWIGIITFVSWAFAFLILIILILPALLGHWILIWTCGLKQQQHGTYEIKLRDASKPCSMFNAQMHDVKELYLSSHLTLGRTANKNFLKTVPLGTWPYCTNHIYSRLRAHNKASQTTSGCGGSDSTAVQLPCIVCVFTPWITMCSSLFKYDITITCQNRV